MSAGRRWAVAVGAMALVGALIVAIPLVQDSAEDRTMLGQRWALGSWARDHSVDPNREMLAVLPKPRLLAAGAARKDVETFYREELVRDHIKGKDSRYGAPAVAPHTGPVGSWAADHGQQRGSTGAAGTAGPLTPKTYAAQLWDAIIRQKSHVLSATEAAPRPALSALEQAEHPGDVQVVQQAVQQHQSGTEEGPSKPTVSSVAAPSIAVQATLRARALAHMEALAQAKAGLPGTIQPRSQGTQEPQFFGTIMHVAQSVPRPSAEAEAEHLNDVRVVQQAVNQHQGVANFKPAAAGSWQGDHGPAPLSRLAMVNHLPQTSERRQASEEATKQGLGLQGAARMRLAVPALQQAAPMERLHALNHLPVASSAPPPTGQPATPAMGSADAWAAAHGTLTAGAEGAMDRLNWVGSAMRQETASYRAHLGAAGGGGSPSLLYQVAAVGGRLGSWAADHGPLLNSAAARQPSRQQVALARADFHANDERAVQAGLQDHKNV